MDLAKLIDVRYSVKLAKEYYAIMSSDPAKVKVFLDKKRLMREKIIKARIPSEMKIWIAFC